MTASGCSRTLRAVQGVRLTPTQRRIAHSLVQHADTAAYLSAAEVAELAQVSQPSVTRFAMALGFDGYPALRRRLRELAAGARAPGADGDDNDLQRAVRAEMDNLRPARRPARRPDARRRAPAELLAASRPLPVLGLRAAAPLAGVLRLLRRQGAPRRAGARHRRQPARRPARTGPRGRRDRDAGDRAAPLPRETLDALREARGAGLAVVAITDSPVSPAAEPRRRRAARRGRHPARVRPAHRARWRWPWCCCRRSATSRRPSTQRRLEEFERSAARRHVFVALGGRHHSDGTRHDARAARHDASPPGAGRRRPRCGC